MSDFRCAICGEVHEDLEAWAFQQPDAWLRLSLMQRALGKLASDLCVTPDGAHFIRCVLVLPVVDGPRDVCEIGVWGAVSEANFQRYLKSYNDRDQSKLGPIPVVLANEIVQFAGSRVLMAFAQPRGDGLRPLMELQPADHPLVRAQRDGIAYQTVLAMVHGHGGLTAPATVTAP